MFVDIDDYKGAIAVENILMPYKKGRLSDDKKERLPKEKITPDVCLEVLRSTNYARNIKDMLLCIAELPQAEQAQFKEVVLATFDNREQPKEIMELGEKLAQNSGFAEEFSKASEIKEGDFIASQVKPTKSYLHLKGLGRLQEDLSGYETLICRGGSPDFTYVKKMPKSLVFEDCMTVRMDANALDGVENIVCKKVDTFSLHGRSWYASGDGEALKRLEMVDCDFVTLENMSFLQAPEVRISGGTNLGFKRLKNFWPPEKFADISFVSLDDIEWADGVKSLKFQNVNGVQLQKLNVPQEIILEGGESFSANADFGATKTLVLQGLQKVDLLSATNLPDVMIEGGKYVEFNHAKFRPQSELVCKGAGNVKLSSVERMPKTLTVADCARLEAYQTDFGGCRFLPQNVADLNLMGSTNLPSFTILSATKKLNIDSTTFADGQKLVLDGVKVVKASDMKKAPEVIKITHADEVHLLASDLQNTKKAIFADVKDVWAGAKSISGGFFTKNCQLVSCSHGEFEPQAKLKFEQIDMVEFGFCEKMPEKLDVSEAKDISITSLKGVKEFVLRDEAQKRQIRSYVFDDFSGNLIYTSPQANQAHLDYRQELNDRFEAQREAAKEQIIKHQQSATNKLAGFFGKLFGRDSR